MEKKNRINIFPISNNKITKIVIGKIDIFYLNIRSKMLCLPQITLPFANL